MYGCSREVREKMAVMDIGGEDIDVYYKDIVSDSQQGDTQIDGFANDNTETVSDTFNADVKLDTYLDTESYQDTYLEDTSDISEPDTLQLDSTEPEDTYMQDMCKDTFQDTSVDTSIDTVDPNGFYYLEDGGPPILNKCVGELDRFFTDKNLLKGAKECSGVKPKDPITVYDMRNCKMLFFSDCLPYGEEHSIMDLSGLECFPYLKLGYFSNDVGGCGGTLPWNTKSVEPLKYSASIEVLNFWKNFYLEDVSALAGLKKLREINLSNTSIADISALEFLPALKEVTIRNVTTLTDLTPLMKNYNFISQPHPNGNYSKLFIQNTPNIPQWQKDWFKNVTDLSGSPTVLVYD